MKYLTVLVLALCSYGALAAKLDHVSRGFNNQPNFFGAGANTARAQDLFGSVGAGYLPPQVQEPKCEGRTITKYETVTLPAQTITRAAPGPSVVYRTEIETSYVTQRPQTIVNTVTNYQTRTSTVAQYNTITSTRISTYVDTEYVTTTAYSIQYSTRFNTVTNTQSVTRTQYNTITNTRTLPASTNYITNTITLPPRVTTLTSTRVSTAVQYSTIYSTQVQVSSYTLTSTRISTAIRPTTVYDVQTTTRFSTQIITRDVQGPTKYVTTTLPAPAIRTPEPFTVTKVQPCETQVKTGYQYNTPAVAFNF